MFEFRFPDVGEGLHEGRLVEWLVEVGQRVTLDQAFARVETDKAVVEIPAPRAAVVRQLHFAPGETMLVGDVMITFADETEPAASSETPRPSGGNGSVLEHATGAVRSVPAPTSATSGVVAMPRTRALARRLGVDLSRVTPTGRAGRITDEDVQRAGAPAARVPDAVDESPRVTRQPVSHLRRVIAEAMSLSKRTAAHVTHVDEADVTDLLSCYEQAKQALAATPDAPKFSLLPYFIRAVVAALKHHPLLNAIYDEARQEIELRHYYNVGIAVDSPDGLLVPVVQHADRKDLVELAAEVADLARRGRERRLNVSELRGATFTISSLGALGGAFATPIIHQPELGIVGLHAIKDRPAVVDGAVVPRKLMYISCSYDHRFIDGAVAARFMDEPIGLINRPALLMLRL